MDSTTVVNVKVKYIRQTGYQNLKQWMEDPINVYIGRRGIVFVDKQRYPKKDSIYANPFKIGKQCTREDCLIKYREHLLKKIENGEITIQNLKDLKGKRLGCWCVVPETHVDCHGHVLLEIASKYWE